MHMSDVGKSELPPRQASSQTPPARNVRGTLLIASRAQIFGLGRGEAYERALGPANAAALRSVLAATWVPMSLAHEHYAVVDSLHIPDVELAECHRKGAERVHGVFLGTALRGMRAVGLLTPLSALALAPKLIGRVMDGGTTLLDPIGSTEVKLHLAGNPLLRHAYYRLGLRAHILSGMLLCANAPQVRQETCDPIGGSIRFGIRWTL